MTLWNMTRPVVPDRLHANPRPFRGQRGSRIRVACLETGLILTEQCLLNQLSRPAACDVPELRITGDCAIPYETENPFKRVKRVGSSDLAACNGAVSGMHIRQVVYIHDSRDGLCNSKPRASILLNSVWYRVCLCVHDSVIKFNPLDKVVSLLRVSSPVRILLSSHTSAKAGSRRRFSWQYGYEVCLRHV